MGSTGARHDAVITRRVAGSFVTVTGVVVIVSFAYLLTHHDARFVTMHYNYDFGDLFARVANLDHLRATGNIYVPFLHFAFTYPPGAIFFFWPILWVPATHLALAWTVLSLGALAGSFFVAASSLGVRSSLHLTGACCWAAVLAGAVFPDVTLCLTWGQTATILMLMILADVLVVRGPAKGVLVGVATAVKIYPGLFIVSWLIRRQWREALTAMATVATISGAAIAAWPASARAYVSHVVLSGAELQKLSSFSRTVGNGSVIAFFQRSPFSYTTLSPHEGLAVSGLLIVVCLVAAQRLWRRGLHLSSTLVVLIASTIGSPIAWDHYFAFLPLLVLVAWEAGVSTGLGAIAVAGALIALVPWPDFRSPRTETTWGDVYSITAQNALFLTTLTVVLMALVYARTRPAHLAPRRDGSSGGRRMRRRDPLARSVATAHEHDQSEARAEEGEHEAGDLHAH
jgi:alpha-1,2-mannosyltransferase